MLASQHGRCNHGKSSAVFFAQKLSFIRHTFYSISLSEWSLNYSLDAVNVKMVVVESGSWLDAMS